MARELLLPECTIAYMQSLWKAKQVVAGEGEPKHSCVLVFDPDTDLTELRGMLKQELFDTFGGEANVPGNAKFALKKGEDAFPGKGGAPSQFAGKYVISSATDSQPTMVKALNGQWVPIIDHSELYSGCRVKAFVGIKGYNMTVNKGVGVYVNGIMKVADGENMEGGTHDPNAMFGSAANVPDTPTATPQAGGTAGADADATPTAGNLWDT